jgi:hypothetical protein
MPSRDAIRSAKNPFRKKCPAAAAGGNPFRKTTRFRRHGPRRRHLTIVFDAESIVRGLPAARMAAMPFESCDTVRGKRQEGRRMSVRQERFTFYFREAGMVLLGLVLAGVPLALWVAWSELVLFAVLAVCALAALLFIALAWLGKDTAVPPPAATAGPHEVVSDEFVAELHRLTPFTYHHRRLGDPRLRRKFARLLTLLKRPDE